MEVKVITSTLKQITEEKEGAKITKFEVTNYDEFYKESEITEADIKHKTEVLFNPTLERREILSTHNNLTEDPMPLTYTAENTNEESFTITDEKTTHVGFNGSITAKALATLSAGVGFSAGLTFRKIVHNLSILHFTKLLESYRTLCVPDIGEFCGVKDLPEKWSFLAD